MGRLEDMKRAAAQGKAKISPPQGKSVLPTPKKGTKPVKTIAPDNSYVQYSCGHRIGSSDFRNRKCWNCTNKERIEKAKNKNQKIYSRLPEGSVKHLEWRDGVWKGILFIPECPTQFEAVAFSEIKCLHNLHDEYLKWLSLQNPPGSEEEKSGT